MRFVKSLAIILLLASMASCAVRRSNCELCGTEIYYANSFFINDAIVGKTYFVCDECARKVHGFIEKTKT